MNRLRTAALFAALTALLMGVGFALGRGRGAGIALAVAAGMNLLTWWKSDRVVLAMHGAREVDGDRCPELVGLVRSLAARAGIPAPRVFVIDSPHPNAFATGRDPAHAAVAATTGLLGLLNREEIAGVLAHELAHIRNRDTLVMTLTATIAGAVAMCANFGLFFGDRRQGLLGGLAALLLAPFAASLVQLAISRAREYGADAGGAAICGNPRALASALDKLDARAARVPNPVALRNPAAAALYIVPGGGRDGWFATHPATANRIAALEAMAPPAAARSPGAARAGAPGERARSAGAEALSAPEGAGVETRRAALRLLDAVLRRGLPLEAALGSATAGLERGDDRAFAHAIAATALRRLPDLDALIDGATPKRLAGDAKARFVLRLALTQALALGTAPHAAIATVLPLVDGGPRRLVHGVFGAIMRGDATLPDPPALPERVAKRWRKAWGPETMEAARVLLAAAPPLDLTLRDPAGIDAWAERLVGVSLAPGHVRLPRGAAVTELPGYAEGAWWVQDIAASLPARLLGRGEGRTALDLCAAPGGKAMQLAAAGWTVTAVDASEPRLERMRENLARTGLAAEALAADVLAWEPALTFDAVLLDAPCSATGIFRRHPDVLHRAHDRAIAELAEGQKAMLARAAEWVKPGGALVYAVCSLERREGEEVADALAADRRFARDPVRAEELPAGIAPGAAGRVRVLPGALAAAGGADGFFVARWRREG